MDEPEIVKVMGQRERILVIKHGALGDIVQGLDAFASLRAGCPNAHIALLTTPAFASLAAMMPWFDEVITDPRAPAFNIRQIIRMRSILRNGWDKIVDLQCSRRTAHYHRFYASSDSRWFGTANGVSDPYPDFTGVNNHRRMLTGVGMAGGRELAPDEVDFSWLRGTKSAAAVPFEGLRGRPFATLIPGCSAAKPQKKWPAERFVALANALHLAGMEIAIVGTKTDRPDADLLMKGAPYCHDLVGKTDIKGLAELLAMSNAVVGNDTGPLFLGARLGARSVMVMGPDTNPLMSAPTGPRCGWLQADPIKDISVDAVLAALDDLPTV